MKRVWSQTLKKVNAGAAQELKRVKDELRSTQKHVCCLAEELQQAQTQADDLAGVSVCWERMRSNVPTALLGIN